MNSTNLVNRIFIVAVFLWFSLYDSECFGQSPLKPKYSYLTEFSFSDSGKVSQKGPARVISVDGRKGLNMSSIYSVLELKKHNLTESRGTVTLWIMPLEDLSAAASTNSMSNSNPFFATYPILSDNPNPQDFNNANFKLTWNSGYHPNLVAMFAKGRFYEDAFAIPHRAFVSVSHFRFNQNTWYQVALMWNYERDQYSVFVNGILIGREDQFRTGKLYRDSVNASIYICNPAICFSDIKFYNQAFSDKEVYRQFKKEVTRFDKKLEDELLFIYAGRGRKKLEWKPDAKWQQQLIVSLKDTSDLNNFYVQGKPVNVQISKEGLLIETINKEYTGALLDSQVYIWTKKPFEGDLYVEYEFKVLRPGGLSLLMMQASGMNREDFMLDYPLRTSGRMTMVYGEDVRNYHWEYYREMADMRNDIATSALMKNPYLYPLSFGSLNKPLEKDVWHKLQFLQIGNKLIGAIDGIVMVEFTDSGSTNNGPVYDFGRMAIRCMLRTKMIFRNLKVYNKRKIEVIKQIDLEK